jgi:hypothetical protein
LVDELDVAFDVRLHESRREQLRAIDEPCINNIIKQTKRNERQDDWSNLPPLQLSADRQVSRSTARFCRQQQQQQKQQQHVRQRRP